MLYGIKFKNNEKELAEYPKEVKKELTTSDKFNIYFSNPVTAIEVASYYEKLDDYFNFSVFTLSAEQEKAVDKSRIVDTTKQFHALHAEITKTSIENTANRSKEERIFANFKEKFDKMSSEEQFAYLDAMGLKYKVQNTDDMSKN